MVIFSLIISFFAALVEFLKGEKIIEIVIPYGFILPLLILLPRFIFTKNLKIKKVVKIDWVKYIERLWFFIMIFNTPGSLILHRLGWQYDRILHFALAFLSSFLVLLILLPVFKIKRWQIEKKKIIILVFLIVFCGLFLWELFQYTIDQLFGTKLFFDVSQNIKVDFWEDIFFGFWGLIGAISYLQKKFEKFLAILK